MLAALVDKEAASGLGKSDAGEQHLMHTSCRQHYRLQTIKHAHDDPDSLICKVCPGGLGSLSSYALAAVTVLEQLPMPAPTWVYESRVLRGSFGPIDFYFPSLKFGVEIDGEQHYLDSMHGLSYEDQQRRDRDKMKRAWLLGIRVLRVPFFDAQYFGKQLQAAVHECITHPTARFILWSTDNANQFGVLERRGDKLGDWLERMEQARAAAKVTRAPCILCSACPWCR